MKDYCELFYRTAPEILDADWDVYYDWIRNADRFALQRALTKVCSYVNSGFRTPEDAVKYISSDYKKLPAYMKKGGRGGRDYYGSRWR